MQAPKKLKDLFMEFLGNPYAIILYKKLIIFLILYAVDLYYPLGIIIIFNPVADQILEYLDHPSSLTNDLRHFANFESHIIRSDQFIKFQFSMFNELV